MVVYFFCWFICAYHLGSLRARIYAFRCSDWLLWVVGGAVVLGLSICGFSISCEFVGCTFLGIAGWLGCEFSLA